MSLILLYEKTLKQLLVDKKIHGKEALEVKVFIIITLIKKEILKSTSFKVEDVFGDVISKDTFSHGQITKRNNF